MDKFTNSQHFHLITSLIIHVKLVLAVFVITETNHRHHLLSNNKLK